MNDLLTTALRALPHGPGFRFIDRLIALDPGRSGSGEYTLKGDEFFMAAHFPGAPMMPGVLVAEAAAQLAGVVAQSDPVVGPLANLRLAALRNVKILGAPRPGDTLRIEAQIVGRLGRLIQAQAAVTVCGQTMLQADLTLSGSE